MEPQKNKRISLFDHFDKKKKLNKKSHIDTDINTIFFLNTKAQIDLCSLISIQSETSNKETT